MPEQQPADELAELRSLGRAIGVERVEWEHPPKELWARIADEAFTPTAASDSPVVSLESRRPRKLGPWLLGAAAAVALVVAGAVVMTRSSDDTTVVAATELELLGDAGQGSAEILDRGGSLQLRLATDGLADTDGFTEVWLINPDITELISLGPIRSDGTYDLPAGFDPAAFPIVDVSFEQFDGNPEHSGNSVLRGQFTF